MTNTRPVKTFEIAGEIEVNHLGWFCRKLGIVGGQRLAGLLSVCVSRALRRTSGTVSSRLGEDGANAKWAFGAPLLTRRTRETPFGSRPLGELIAIGRKSVKLRALLRELLDKRPVIGSFKANRLAAAGGVAGNAMFADQASDRQMPCRSSGM
jgi:hypothetical protein